MRRWLKRAAVLLVVAFAAAQLVRPARANPPIDARHTIQGSAGPASGIGAIVDRACRDCHSNATVWPWYTGIAPVSWLMAKGVKLGRAAVNFSEWSSYPPERQRELLEKSCKAVREGKMPGGAWTTLHPEAKLTPEDVQRICAAAETAPNAGGKP